jgi:hypothetical protein
MRVYKEKDGERVTTPVMVGFGSMPKNDCEHEWALVGTVVPVEEVPEISTQMSRCIKCNLATRMHYTGDEEVLNKHLPAEKKP